VGASTFDGGSDTQPILVESGMSVHTCRSGDGAELTISVDGRFDFTVHEQFRVAYESSPVVATLEFDHGWAWIQSRTSL
jgi:hypothetical protein